MDISELEDFGSNEKYLYKSELKKVKPHSPLNELLIGFDTEYNSKTNDLISIQLSIKGNKYLFDYRDKQLTFDKLYQHTVNICKKHNIVYGQDNISSFVYVAFFSIAEAQHLAYEDGKIEIIEYGSGNYDFCRKINGKQTMRILDLQVWFRGWNLASVAEMFGYKKLDNQTDKFDISKVTKKTLDIEEFRKYAKHDPYLCEMIMRDLRKEFWNLWQVDILKTRTPAASSMHIFKRDYMKKNIVQENTNIRKLALLCSWGGNNQCFKRGDYDFRGTNKKFYEYDAVSMYPNACINLNKLPRQEDWIYCTTLSDFIREKNIGGICEIAFKFPKNTYYPCLPVYHEGKLVYPLSSNKCHCTLEEIKLALEMGAKINFKKGFVYQDGVTDLSDYLKMLLKKKADMTKTGDIVRRTLYKLMMNSIIGKFTQKVHKYNINTYKKWSDILEEPIYSLMNTRGVGKLIARKLIYQAYKDNEITQDQAEEYFNSYEKFVKDFEVPMKKQLNLGSGYYPEWNTLILGYSRATLARAFWEKGAYLGTTDSFITDENPADGVVKKHNKKTGELMEIGYFDCNGIRFEFERTGKRLVSVRTRLYSLFDENNNKGHMAFHGISNFKKANEFLKNPKWDKEYREYTSKHIVKVREALSRQKKLAHTEMIEKKVSWKWDNKRELTGVTKKINDIKEKITNILDDEIKFMWSVLKGSSNAFSYQYKDEQGFMNYRRAKSSHPDFFFELGLSGTNGKERFKKAMETKNHLYKDMKIIAKERIQRKREWGKPPNQEYPKLVKQLEKLNKKYKKGYQEDSKPFTKI